MKAIDVMLIIGVALPLGTPASGQNRANPSLIALKAGSLATALRDLSAQSGAELLFSTDVVGDRRSPRVGGASTVEGLLQRLLAGSGLAFRKTSEGAFIIYPEADPAPAIPEILVVGKRTQNADIRRTANDIQPYQVVSARDIAGSHADNVDMFLRARLPSNAEPQPPSQNPVQQSASNRSEVNLHGLGANQTLVLIDGARMPSTPSTLGDLTIAQPDLNGLPTAAIDRIETLTGTAGGIYGPGALGGVVNVVLKRDYRGADLNLSSGLSTRGDASRKQIDGRFGFTPDAGSTDVMLAFSRSATSSLRFGDRAYAAKARASEISDDPAGFLRTFPTANARLVRTLSGANLTLDAALGGATLGSSFTYLPLVGSGGISTLTGNSGQIPSALAPDANGQSRSLTNATDVTFLLANARHRFGADVEAFIDLIGFQNDGHAVNGSVSPTIVGASAPGNPFGQDVLVSFPEPGFDVTTSNRLRTVRLSSGLIIALPGAWRSDINLSLGSVRNHVSQVGSILGRDFASAALRGKIGVSGEPAPDPFGDWQSFLATLQAYKTPLSLDVERKTLFRNVSVRVAGPLWVTGAGTTSLSLLAEHRREKVPVTALSYNLFDETGAVAYPGFTQTVSSLYAELRAPLVARKFGPRGLRGLEAQLAVRYDDNKAVIPNGSGFFSDLRPLSSGEAATAYTAGMRVFPLEFLMLRASLATGVLPPTPNQLLHRTQRIVSPDASVTDPLRGGTPLASEGPVDVLSGGSVHLRPERARTLSFGLVLNPDDGQRPRIAFDLTHIRKRDEIADPYDGDIAFFIANESRYPHRIVRAPLTAADLAAGLTKGVITEVDTGAINIGRTRIDALDLRADYTLAVGSDHFRPYGAATWQLDLWRSILPGDPSVNYVGSADGPLRWRGNAGVDWDHGPLTLGLNGQYYAEYNTRTAVAGAAFEPTLAQLITSRPRIPAQVYFDLSTTYRIVASRAFGRVRSVEFRLGIQNLLDHEPPFATSTSLGYSYYGDPRRRRVELNMAAHF